MIYIEIVGLDGAGKSRLVWSLKHHFGDCARMISVSMAEVTYSSACRVTTSNAISPVTRAIAYMAAHSEAYDKIASDLDAGIDYLIGDRGYGCFSAYQHRCPVEIIDALWSVAMRGLFPDLVVFVDTPVLMCQERISRRRNPSALDKKPVCWHEAVRERYLAFCGSYDRGEVLILDGSRHPNILRKRVLKELKRLSQS